MRPPRAGSRASGALSEQRACQTRAASKWPRCAARPPAGWPTATPAVAGAPHRAHPASRCAPRRVLADRGVVPGTPAGGGLAVPLPSDRARRRHNHRESAAEGERDEDHARAGFSDAACAGEGQAITLASALEAELTFVHVIVEPMFNGESPFGILDAAVSTTRSGAGPKRIAERVVTATARGVAARFVLRTAVPHEQLLAAAQDEKPDILVIGTHRRTGFYVSRRVRCSQCDRTRRRDAGPGCQRPAPRREGCARASPRHRWRSCSVHRRVSER